MKGKILCSVKIHYIFYLSKSLNKLHQHESARWELKTYWPTSTVINQLDKKWNPFKAGEQRIKCKLSCLMEEQLSSSLSDREKSKWFYCTLETRSLIRIFIILTEKYTNFPNFCWWTKPVYRVFFFLNLSFHSRDFYWMHHHELPTITCSVFCSNKLNWTQL